MTDNTTDATIRALEADGRHRVLRRLPEQKALVEHMVPAGTERIAIVDIETTGLDPERDSIIEIAVMLVDVDRANGCELVAYSVPESWLQDPGQPLDAKICKITGLEDSMLAGQQIDERAALLLECADLIVAHNAAFDCAFIERRWPILRGLKWACSCHEIDWLELGFDGRSLGYLLSQMGFFNSAHRAADDVWSLFYLLRWVPAARIGERERSLLECLIEASETETYRVEATDAPFHAKDLLKARGYRWDPARKVWWTEMATDHLHGEQMWFEAQGLPAPTSFTLDARQRHR